LLRYFVTFSILKKVACYCNTLYL